MLIFTIKLLLFCATIKINQHKILMQKNNKNSKLKYKPEVDNQAQLYMPYNNKIQRSGEANDQ